MLYIVDLATSESDDLIIYNGDIAIENGDYTSTIKTAERRCSARYDDFTLDDVAAGIERYLYQDINIARYNITFDLKKVLKASYLFSDSDFDIVIPKVDNKSLQVFIKINSSLTKSNGFRVITDQLNQQSYR